MKAAYRNFLISICGGLLSLVITVPISLYAITVQVDLQKQGMEKKAHLVMAIPPRQFGVFNYTEVLNMKLTLPRNENYPISFYVFNDGNSFGHILYYYIYVLTDTGQKTSSFHNYPLVLGPSETTTINWTFVPLDFLQNSTYLNMTFMVGCIEANLTDTIQAYWA